MTEHVECVVIGAGVVGLAIARRLALCGRETLVLEAARAIGTGISSRNSEVVHAGIYYTPNSQKATACVAGRRLLYSFCAAHGVPVRRCGKLIVAVADEELAALSALESTARANGVQDIRSLTAAAARALEPELCCRAALWSPSSGIVDSGALMLALRGDLEQSGGSVALGAPLRRAGRARDGWQLEVGGDAPTALRAAVVINSAGLEAQEVACRIDGLPPESIPPRYLAKGSYFTLATRAPFERLIYPIPAAGGLGIHLTLDLGGRARFGPDLEWIDRIDYRVDAARAAAFYPAIRRYWPALPDGALRPGYAGIRPKLGAGLQDFVIQGPSAHGLAGLINLYGIESPGLTAALAIAEQVAGLV